MKLERLGGATFDAPFPVHRDLAGALLAGHVTAAQERDPTIAHVLATFAGYSYSDSETVAMVMSRLGLDGHVCVRISQTVDAMLVFSTAYLVQSRCGRVVILSYRGTEPMNIGNWLGDSDVGPTAIRHGAESLTVHSGFYRNMRATRWAVMDQLNLALAGRSLLNPDERVPHSMEALYVTGHSLGGAMAALFLLSVASDPAHRAVADRLRAVYTFGQPLAIGELSAAARHVAPRLFRHALARDIVPRLPIQKSGRLVHFGREYLYEKENWRETRTPLAQLKGTREVSRSVIAYLGVARRPSPRYTLANHGPHCYMDALAPRGTITELGDHV